VQQGGFATARGAEDGGDPGTGEIRKRTRYEAGARARESALDTDGDGITDTRVRYDRYGEPERGD